MNMPKMPETNHVLPMIMTNHLKDITKLYVYHVYLLLENKGFLRKKILIFKINFKKSGI